MEHIIYNILVIDDGEIQFDHDATTEEGREVALKGWVVQRFTKRARSDISDYNDLDEWLGVWGYDVKRREIHQQVYTLAEIRNGTGFPRGARFVQVAAE
jgi:hypothetical protein